MLVRGNQTFHTPHKKVQDKKTYVYIRGLCRYARTITPDPTYDKWSICLYPRAEDMPKVHELINQGIRNKLKMDDDGHYITWSRPIKIEKKNGTSIPLDPPKVVDSNGVELAEFIGDGSDTTVKLETYGGPGPGGRGSYKAARLEAVQVHTLVPWKTTKEVEEKNEQPAPF